MAATKVIVAPDKDGGWTVDQPDPTPRITALATQRDAMARAREELRRLGGGEIEIRARDSPTLTLLEHTREALGQLEQVHAALMGELAEYVGEHHENLLEGDFALSDFVDRFGPKLAHLNTMLAVLRPLAAAQKKSEG